MKIPPVQQNNNIPPLNIQMLKMFLPKITAQEMEQMKQMAKQMGMSEDQITQGLSLLDQIK